MKITLADTKHATEFLHTGTPAVASVQQKFLKSYEEYSDAIFRYCYYRVFDREKAKDYVQETYCRTWKYIIKGNDVENLRAFLYRAANNIIIDGYRKKKNVSLDQIMQKGFTPKTDGRKKTEEYFMNQDILALVKSLDEKYRDVILLKYVEDMATKQIARLLGETENNVYVRISRGLEKVREIIKQQEGRVSLHQ